MAHRLRGIISERENVHPMPAKHQPTKALTRRPALDELSNKLPVKPATKKQEEIKPDKERLIKASHLVKKETEPIKSYSSNQLQTVINHDAKTSSDPQMVSEYLTDIFDYLREMEIKYPIRNNFLEGHKSSPRMRTILVNWLVQVHTNFSLCLETLFLCVSIIDRYLQDHPQVGTESLQLVGASALLVACKYEEIYVPQLSDFVYICDDSFSERKILQMESSILVGLDFSLGKPLPIHFLRRYSKLADVKPEHHNLSKYLLELALLNHTFAPIKPSIQAAAACCLSLAILNNATSPCKVWTPHLTHTVGYKYSDFASVIVKFAQMLLSAETSKYKTVQGKYAESKHNKISTHPKLKGTLVKKLAESSPKA